MGRTMTAGQESDLRDKATRLHDWPTFGLATQKVVMDVLAELDAERAALAEAERERDEARTLAERRNEIAADWMREHGKKAIALAAAQADNARLREWADNVTDFLDELWKAFPSESAAHYGANALLNEWNALAQRPEHAALVALCGRVAQEAFDLGESMGRGHIVTETKQQLVDRVLQGAHPVEK